MTKLPGGPPPPLPLLFTSKRHDFEIWDKIQISCAKMSSKRHDFEIWDKIQISCAKMSRYAAKFKYQGQNSNQTFFGTTNTLLLCMRKTPNPAALTPPPSSSLWVKNQNAWPLTSFSCLQASNLSTRHRTQKILAKNRRTKNRQKLDTHTSMSLAYFFWGRICP